VSGWRSSRLGSATEPVTCFHLLAQKLGVLLGEPVHQQRDHDRDHQCGGRQVAPGGVKDRCGDDGAVYSGSAAPPWVLRRGLKLDSAATMSAMIAPSGQVTGTMPSQSLNFAVVCDGYADFASLANVFASAWALLTAAGLAKRQSSRCRRRATGPASAHRIWIHPGRFHAIVQGLAEYERGGGLEFAAEQAVRAGCLESQGPPALATGADIGEFHLAPWLLARPWDGCHDLSAEAGSLRRVGAPGGTALSVACYPARLLMVRTMKSTITNSLTTHELVFIQSRALGRKARPRLPNASRMSAGSASNSSVSSRKGRRCRQGSSWLDR
jgi:hypothetical protein